MRPKTINEILAQAKADDNPDPTGLNGIMDRSTLFGSTERSLAKGEETFQKFQYERNHSKQEKNEGSSNANSTADNEDNENKADATTGDSGSTATSNNDGGKEQTTGGKALRILGSFVAVDKNKTFMGKVL
jgi:hypothetical protein